MASVITQMRSRRGPMIVGAVVAAVAMVVVLLLVLGMQRPMQITVDGKPMTVEARTTVSKLVKLKVFTALRGDLLSVKDGKIVRKNGGGQPLYLRNGKPIRVGQVVHAGDVLVSQRGPDKTERIVTKRVPIDPPVREEGKGPIAETVATGTAGVSEVTAGAVSGIVLSSRVVTQPVAELVRYRAAKPGDKIVALTFDDGPWPHSTDQILDILKQNKIKATFFMLGARARVQPDTAKRVVAEGHVVGNHTLSHRIMTREKSQAVLRTQIGGGQRYISQATGVTPKWFRPPGGAINGTSWKLVKAAGLRVVLWDVDSLDWTRPGYKRIASNVINNVKPGSIVLMHDGGGPRDQTVAALPRIIRELRKRGYQFATLDQLGSK